MKELDENREALRHIQVRIAELFDGRLGRAGLVVHRRGDNNEIGRTRQVQVVVLSGCRPVIPFEEDAGLLARPDGYGVALVGAGKILEAIRGQLCIGESPAPVFQGMVASCAHPQNPVRARAGDDGVRCAGAAAPISAAGVEPDHRVIDNLDSLGDGVVFRLGQADLILDTDQVELGSRRHLVNDLGHARAVHFGGREGSAAVVNRGQRARQVAAGLESRVAGEAEVDDADLHAGPVPAHALPGAGAAGGGPLARNRGRHRTQRRAHAAYRRMGCEGFQRGDRNQRARQSVGFRLDTPAHRRGGVSRGAGRIALDHDLNGLALNPHTAAAGLGYGSGRSAFSARTCSRGQPGIELRMLVRCCAAAERQGGPALIRAA